MVQSEGIMAGKPGMKGDKLGGPRPGAGRPIKTRTLTLGQEFAGLEAGEQPQVYRVVELNRTTIVIQREDGHTIRLLT